MALSDIIEKIKEDTDREVAGIRKKADEAVDAIIAECEEECRTIREHARTEGERRSAETRKRMKIEAELETRKDLLKGRKALIEKAFEQATESLYNDEERYKQFLEEQIFRAAEYGNEKVIFSEHDYERFGDGLQKIIASANERLFEDDRKGELVLTNEQGEFRGGSILKKGRARIIMTLEAVMSDLRDSFETEVASILMSSEE